MSRTFVILRHTFREAIVQPIFTLLLVIGAAVVVIFSLLPFFTLSEDTLMFKDVSLDVILLVTLITTLFATSKSIHEEIEDRTMLTLMSKPLRKSEVLVGKYLGIVLATLLGVAALGAVLMLCTYFRIPADYNLSTITIDEREIRRTLELRHMHLAGLAISLMLVWLQVSVLAAVGVALSTRFSLVVNLPTVIILYVAGNLTRFLFPLSSGPLADRSSLVKGFAYVLSLVLPYLEVFDLRQATIYRPLAWAGTQFASDPRAVALTTVLTYLGVAALYAIAYSAFALGAGMWLFHNRELGGSES
jgi:ABC-type transport system involved in multi-copper enzyme maturation permease subunit